jgi:hypothetical protein
MLMLSVPDPVHAGSANAHNVVVGARVFPEQRLHRRFRSVRHERLGRIYVDGEIFPGIFRFILGLILLPVNGLSLFCYRVWSFRHTPPLTLAVVDRNDIVVELDHQFMIPPLGKRGYQGLAAAVKL